MELCEQNSFQFLFLTVFVSLIDTFYSILMHNSSNGSMLKTGVARIFLGEGCTFFLKKLTTFF